MGIIHKAIKAIHYADEMSNRNNWLNKLHPLTKLMVVFWYLLMVVSVPKYGLGILLNLTVFPVLIMMFFDFPLGKILRRLWFVLLILSFPGMANLFFDKTEYATIGNFVITGGMISMLSLLIKGVLGVFTSFILLSSTSIEKICYGLQRLHIPNKLVVLIMLIYRYLILLLKEAERITLAYEMRSGGRKAINYKVWGTMAGSLFLRSADRAKIVYESMTLRGFNGTFYQSKIPFKSVDLLTIIFSVIAITIFRFGITFA